MSFESTPAAQRSLPQQQVIRRVIDQKGETIVFEATLFKEIFESHLRSNYLASVGFVLYCICYPCVKRQARKVAESWHLYVTEKTLCFYLVDRNLYGCTFPKVSVVVCKI